MTSPLEQLLLQQIADAGLPLPETEFKFESRCLFTKHRPPRRRRWRFDMMWGYYRICVEIDGGTWIFGRHSRGLGYESDCEKLNEAVERGWRCFRFTGDMVKDGRAITQIRRVIEWHDRTRLRNVLADESAELG